MDKPITDIVRSLENRGVGTPLFWRLCEDMVFAADPFGILRRCQTHLKAGGLPVCPEFADLVADAAKIGSPKAQAAAVDLLASMANISISALRGDLVLAFLRGVNSENATTETGARAGEILSRITRETARSDGGAPEPKMAPRG